jgi:hypothetical protein
MNLPAGHPGGGAVRLADPGARRPQLQEYDGKLSPDQKRTFASHGVDVDYSTNRMVTADYMDVLSSVVASEGPQPPLG